MTDAPEHPEDLCDECGNRNPSWHAPNELWNKVTGHPPGLVICPMCFQEHAEALGITVHCVSDLLASNIKSEREKELREAISFSRTELGMPFEKCVAAFLKSLEGK